MSSVAFGRQVPCDFSDIHRALEGKASEKEGWWWLYWSVNRGGGFLGRKECGWRTAGSNMGREGNEVITGQ